MSERQRSDVDLDAALDALYQSPPDRFTAERNALAAERRKAGDREQADRIKALAKPTATAWAVNQAWWRDQPTFRAMLDAGAQLRSAHLARARGKAADVRSAADARQRAIDAVIETAVDALGGPGKVNPDTRHRIAGTVDALASGGVPADVAMGRLSKDLHATGLEALSALAGDADAVARPAPPPSRPVIVSRREAKPARSKTDEAEANAAHAARVRAEKIAKANTHLAAREEALRAAEADVATTSKAEKKASAALEASAARVTDLEAKLDAAREDERSARRALAQATRAASEAEMNQARTARDVKNAREQLDEIKRT